MSVVCGFAFAFCFLECLPFAKPAKAPEKAWKIHLVNTYPYRAAMHVSASLGIVFLAFSGFRYVRLRKQGNLAQRDDV